MDCGKLFSSCIQKGLEKSGSVPADTSYERWVEGMRRAQHPDRITEEQEKHLGVEPKNMFEVSQSFPHFDDTNYALSVDNFLRSNSVTVEAVKNMTNWSSKEKAPQFRTKETRPGLGRTLPHDVMYFLKMQAGGQAENRAPLVLKYETEHSHCCGAFTLTGRSQDQDLLTGIVGAINKWKAENNIYKGQLVTAAGKFMKRTSTSINDIILNKSARKEVDQYVRKFFQMKGAFEKNGMQHKRGIILEGPPGTGKTLLGRVLANEMEDVTFIWGTAKDLSDGMREIFKWARELTPAVLFLEDIDFFGMSRPISASSYSVDTVKTLRDEGDVSKASGDDHDMGELLTQLDGFEGNDGLLVVATTNHLGALDEALKNRPGRFDVKITLSYPDERSRVGLLKLWTKNLILKNVDKFGLVAKTQGFTPAQIREVVTRAVLHAVDKGLVNDQGIAVVTQSCFDSVLESWR